MDMRNRLTCGGVWWVRVWVGGWVEAGTGAPAARAVGSCMHLAAASASGGRDRASSCWNLLLCACRCWAPKHWQASARQPHAWRPGRLASAARHHASRTWRSHCASLVARSCQYSASSAGGCSRRSQPMRGVSCSCNRCCCCRGGDGGDGDGGDGDGSAAAPFAAAASAAAAEPVMRGATPFCRCCCCFMERVVAWLLLWPRRSSLQVFWLVAHWYASDALCECACGGQMPDDGHWALRSLAVPAAGDTGCLPTTARLWLTLGVLARQGRTRVAHPGHPLGGRWLSGQVAGMQRNQP
jgi:hypothetical protein